MDPEGRRQTSEARIRDLERKVCREEHVVEIVIHGGLLSIRALEENDILASICQLMSAEVRALVASQ
jgi:hypothetical protein